MPAPLSIAFWNYDRTLPIAHGLVAVEGWEVQCQILRPQELFPRAFGQAEFDVAELSFTRYLIARAGGDTRYTALPVFLSRSFRHASLYVRGDRGISQPQHLAGCTIGLNNYDDTAAVVVRGMLRDDHGIGRSDITWCVGDMQASQAPRVALPDLPADVRVVSAGTRTLDDMLVQGDLDGVIAINPPPSFGRAGANIVRLFPNWRAAERDWFARTGVFPIMHVLGVRTSMLQSHAGLARNLFEAFSRAKQYAMDELGVLQAAKVTLPWVAVELEETRALMGNDYWPYGLAANHAAIAAGLRYCSEDGLLSSPIEIADVFASDMLET
ncbi:MAG: ABC transporter substrate-binding protein [Variovorax sp.]